MRIDRRSALGIIVAGAVVRPSFAAEAFKYLFPAPSFLPGYMPFHIAKARGYFAEFGVAPTFQVGRGGADVAQQVAVGNVELGGGTGETPMIVRPNGLPVRAVAQLGSRSLFTIVTRKDLNVRSLADLRGKTIGALSYQDTSFYTLLGALAGYGLKRADVEIQAVGPAGMTQLMIAKSLDGIVSIPEWTDAIETAGVPLDRFSIDDKFPAMAQAILASDKIIEQRPALVRGAVKAVLKAVRDCVADPASAARDFITAVPQHAGKEREMERILRQYVDTVYKTEPASELGKFDPDRMKTVQKFYLDNQIIRTAVPIDELYTNKFVE